MKGHAKVRHHLMKSKHHSEQAKKHAEHAHSAMSEAKEHKPVVKMKRKKKNY